MRKTPRGDTGSMLPLILVFVMIVVLMLMGMTAASSAFLAQSNLQSMCDATAGIAASGTDLDELHEQPSGSESLTISEQEAQLKVDEYRQRHADDFPSLTMVVNVDSEQAVLSCHYRVKIVFGRAFGKGDGLDRDTESRIRSVTPSAEPSIVG